MLAIGVSWLVLSLFVGVLASKVGRDGIAWAFIAFLVSPFFALIGLLVVGKVKDEAVTDAKNSDGSTPDSEWVIVKKYVPEICSSLDELSVLLNGKGLASAESKLKELFGVMGKEGLTPNAIKIIATDVLAELAEEERKADQVIVVSTETEEKAEESPKVDMALITKLKGSKKVGFSKVPQECGICHVAKTQQLIEEHHICGRCKLNYL